MGFGIYIILFMELLLDGKLMANKFFGKECNKE